MQVEQTVKFKAIAAAATVVSLSIAPWSPIKLRGIYSSLFLLNFNVPCVLANTRAFFRYFRKSVR
jgi:hypothetical protein